MRVAITNPYVWPHVRRGSERLLDDLARHLVARGHCVSVFAMGPENAMENRDGISYHLLRQRLGGSPRQFNRLHWFAFRLQDALRDCDADTVFCLNYFDAFAALRARQRYHRRYKVIFQSVGIPTRAYFRAVPIDAWFMRTVLTGADQLLVLSSFARDSLRQDFNVDAMILPPPVMVDQFGDEAGEHAVRKADLRILFVGDADEPRKGARVLCRAFRRIKSLYPEAQLLFSGRATEATRRVLLSDLAAPELCKSVHFLGVGKVSDLPRLYRSAAVTVLPAVWEAFGLVLVESLAAGTPVVGARHGGITDIIDSHHVGRVFEPGPFAEQSDNVDGLVTAVQAVLATGKSDVVRDACRARAQEYSWSRLGPIYENVLGNRVRGLTDA